MRVPLPRPRALTAIAVAIVLAIPASSSAAAPDFDALLRPTPYARLWTQVGACHQAAAVNSLTGAQLDRRLTDLTRWFRHFNAQSSNRFLLGRDCMGTGTSTLASKLGARGAWVSTYRNGSSTSQSGSPADPNFYEAADLERTAPLAIATFWPGDWSPARPNDPTSGAARLTAPLSRTTRTIAVRAVGPPGRPPETRRAWPFIPSRGSGLEAGATSRNTRDVVSWIRIGNEIMQVVEPPAVTDGTVTLRVRRAIWGTAARRHTVGTRVLAPVYIGSAAQDAHLAGTPIRNDRAVPLRYGLKVWKTDAQRWLIGRIGATFGSWWQGHNTIWLDTTSCVQYSNADAYGNPVSGWDDRVDRKLTFERWGAAQRAKIRALREAFPTRKVIANNLAGSDTCTEKLLADVDAGAFEHWLKWGDGRDLDWPTSLAHLIAVQRDDLPAKLWVRWSYDFSGNEARYRRFAYGSYLLVRRPSASRTTFGGPWELRRPEDLFFWDWGAPSEPANELDPLRIGGTDLYRRDFRNGIVLVNPGSESVTVALGRTFYDVVHRTTSGTPRAVTSVTVPARDAALLLRPA